MAEYGAPQNGFWDKAIPAFCGLLLVCALISVPFMARDNERIRQQTWKAEGCKMYDDYKVQNVPAKCQTYFVDHYKAQQQRIQPPEAK